MALPIGGWFSVNGLGGHYATVFWGVATAAVGLVRPLRRAFIRRCLCVVSQHRLRTGLAHAWVHNRRGRLPAILWTRPTPDGEAVLIWCPAGVSERQVRAATDVLCAACWAQSVWVSADPVRSHLVTVHVVRRAGPATGGDGTIDY
jgi:hypothetical protein